MAQQKNIPQIRFKGFTQEWEASKYSETFTKIPNNTLSRADLNYNSGLAKNVHYGDVLIKFGELLNVEKDTIPFITNDTLANRFRSSKLQNGDIVIADAAEDEMVGKCTELLNVGEETVVSGLHTIPSRPVLPFASGYLGYFMNSPAYHNQLLRLMQGTKVLSISKAVLQDTAIAYPIDNAEQSKLGTLFSHLDQLITLKQQKYNKLVTVKKAMLEKMFPQNGATVPQIRFKGFTEEWEEKKLGDESIEIIAGGDIDKSKIVDSGKYPVLANALTNDGILGYYENSFRVKAPALTVTGRGDVGHAKVRNTDFTPVVRLLSIKTKHDVYFLENVINNHEVLVESTGVPQLTTPQLSNYQIYLPKTENEEKIIGMYFKRLDNLIDLQQQELEKLKQVKKGCLEKMFV